MRTSFIFLAVIAAFLGTTDAERVDVQAMAEAIKEPKRLCVETPLFVDGQPAAVLVAPGDGLSADEVQAVNEYLKQTAGKALPVKKDAEITDDDYRKRHLLVLGNLSTNRVARRMYAKQFAYCDRVFPGKGRFIIRTIHDPLGWGRNVVLLGGSDEDGVHAAAAEFIEILKKLETTTLPHLIVRQPGQFDVEALPKKKSAEETIFDEPTELGEDGGKRKPKRPAHPIARLLDSSDKEAIWRMLNEPAQRYILNGDIGSARKYKDAMVSLADHDRGCASRSAKWFQKEHSIWQYWNQIEECGLFSDSERLVVDRFMMRLAFACLNEVLGVPTVGAALRDPAKAENNHWSGLWMAQVYYGMHYVHTCYPSPETEARMRQFGTYVKGLADSFKPDEDATGYQEGFQEVKAKLLLHAEELRFFTNGNARRTADLLLAPLTNLGTLAAYGDAAGPRPGFRQSNTYLNAASLMLGDGQYAWAAHQHQAAKGFYKGAGARHAYTNDFPLAEPRQHVGLKVLPLDPAFCRRWGKTPPSDRGFDKITLRTGWDREDDYLMLQGIGRVGIHAHYDTNAIVRYQAGGQDWLVDDSYTRTGIRNHSMVTISREGRSTPIPPLARLDTAFGFADEALVRTTVADWAGADWTRNVFWLRNDYVAVIDEVRAEESGTFMLRNLWRHTGQSRLMGNTLVSDQDGVRFCLASADNSSASVHATGEVLTDKRRIRELWRLAGPRLESGQSYAFLSLLWTQKKDEPSRYRWLPITEHAAILSNGKTRTIVGIGSPGELVTMEDFRITARAFWLSGERIVLADATKLQAGGTTVLDSPEPVTVELDLATGKHRFAGRAGKLLTPVARVAAPLEACIAWAEGAAKRALSEPGAEQPVTPVALQWSVSGGTSSPRLFAGNLNDDPADEVLVYAGRDAIALNLAGKELWRFRAPANLVRHAPVVSDMDGDGMRDILVADGKCNFLVLSLEGALKRRINPGLPAPKAFAAANLGVFGSPPKVKEILDMEEEPTEDDGFEAGLRAERVEKDRIKEIVLGYQTGRFDGQISAVDLNGTRGWVVNMEGYPLALCVEDFDGDGKHEILNAASRTDWDIRNFRGKVVCANRELGGARAVRLTDLDGDGRLEVVATESWYDSVFVLGPKLRLRWKQSTGEDPVGPALADLDGDDKLEVLVGSALGNVNCYSHDGRSRWVAGVQLPLSRLAVLRTRDGKVRVLAAGANSLVELDARGNVTRRRDLPAEIRDLLVVRAADGREAVLLSFADGRVCRVRD